MNPINRSRTKNENPLLQHTKSKGFSFCRRQVHWGVDVSPTTKTLIRFVLMTAQSSGRISRTRRWVDAHWGFLRRADDAYTGNERKRKALIRGYSNQGCAHDCSARFALQGVRRSRPRWELALFDKSRTNRPFPPTCGGTKSYQTLCA